MTERMPWRLVLVGLALIAFAIPMILEMVPRNRLYGFRTAYTMSSDEAWYRGNRIAGFTVLAAGAAWSALALILPLAWTSDRALWWVVGLGILSLGLALATSWVLVHRGH
jgi:uncharacterized membrane protein